jgi:hypothetical protein
MFLYACVVSFCADVKNVTASNKQDIKYFIFLFFVCVCVCVCKLMLNTILLKLNLKELEGTFTLKLFFNFKATNYN